MEYAPQNMDEVYKRLQALSDKARAELVKEGFSDDQIYIEPFLNLRYSGTDTSIMTSLHGKDGTLRGDYAAAFEKQHRQEYGFTIQVHYYCCFIIIIYLLMQHSFQGRAITIDDLRARGVGRGTSVKPVKIDNTNKEPKPTQYCETYFEVHCKYITYVEPILKIYFRKSDVLRQQYTCFQSQEEEAKYLDQPSLSIRQAPLQQNLTVRLLSPRMKETLSLIFSKQKRKQLGMAVENLFLLFKEIIFIFSTEVDSVQLSVFAHRFMGIAEQMGKTLQRTSVSTNIKERLDFSCALFGVIICFIYLLIC